MGFIMRKRTFREIRGYIVSIAIFAIIVAVFAVTLSTTGQSSDERFLEAKKDAVRKAVVSCYAIEGSYPSDIDYLREHYGLQVDESKYIIHYEIFASNIMPDFDVIPRSK